LWTLVPRDLTWGNFRRLFETGFGQALLNSAIVTVGTLVGGLFHLRHRGVRPGRPASSLAVPRSSRS
jgi:hypothetical protein